MFVLSTSFRTILTNLRAALGRAMARDHARIPLLTLVWTRVGRSIARFETLFARWRANTLPKPRKSRAGQARPSRPKPFFPTTRAWLVFATGHETAGCASQLQYLLAGSPDLADFLAAAPQANRILRPLCHMLGVQMPGDPPPPAPKPAKPPKPVSTPSLPPPPAPERPALRWGSPILTPNHPIFSKAR